MNTTAETGAAALQAMDANDELELVTVRRSNIAAGFALAVACVVSSSAVAATIELPGDADRTRVTYACKTSENAEPAKTTVEYINLPESSFAIVPLEGRPTLFVNVLSGSGAQYVSGRMVWWTKGPGARLYDVTTDDPSKAVLCRVER